SDGNGSHASTLKSPSYTKSVSWQHYPGNFDGIDNVFSKKELTEYNTASSYIRRNVLTKKNH
ncbi:hypothetical protein, partial [Escherichia coli]|uniref:hypothetical protein n=1 Tax=Escherichia coli TaxID=562 RepID=UPI00311AE832